MSGERRRILAQEFAEPVKAMYAESMRLSPRWAAEYRGFWDLPEDFEYEVATPTVRSRARSPAGSTPTRPPTPSSPHLTRNGGGARPGRAAGTLDERDAGGAARRAPEPA